MIKNMIKENYGLHSDLIDKYVDHKNDKYTFTGKKFDCLFVDTASCYHRGSRRSLKDRYIFIIFSLSFFLIIFLK